MELIGVMAGAFFIIMGIGALVFNKYPAKDAQIMKLKEQYQCVDEKKLCKFEGTYFLIIGALVTIIGFMPNNNIVINSTIGVMIVTYICYNPLRRKFLGLN